MTTKQLNYKALPIIAAADGATSPALTANDKGAMAFSTTTNKPMSWDGTKWNLLTKVDSVAGRIGAVTVTKTDVGLGSVDNVSAASLRDRTTHTGEQAISTVTGLQTALNGKASTGHSHSDVTTTSNGFMTSADKVKLDGIVPANLLSRANHTGTQAISTIDTLQSTLDTKASTGHSHTEATTSVKGFMSSADKAKLDGIVTANLVNRANHTGEQAISTITGLQAAIDGRASSGHTHADATSSAGGFMSRTDKAKLDALNSSTLLDRANHTGFQAIATITGLQGALDVKASTGHTHSNATASVAGFMSADDKNKLNSIPPQVMSIDQYLTQDGNVNFGSVTATNLQANDQVTCVNLNVNNIYGFDSLNPSALSWVLWGADAAYGFRTTFSNSGQYDLKKTTNGALEIKVDDISRQVLHEGNVKTINGQAIVGSGDLVISGGIDPNTPLVLNQDATINGMTIGRAGSTQSTALGRFALSSSVKGGSNVAIGDKTMWGGSVGTGNVAVGVLALANSPGNYNVAVGLNAMSDVKTTASYSVAVGYCALLVNEGFKNVAIGYNALRTCTTGSNNIGIGSTWNSNDEYSPVFSVVTESNRIVMGNTDITNAYIQVPWTVVSDARDKTNFAAIPHGLEFVKQLKPTAYQFRASRDSDQTNGGVRYGFKAQDIAAIEPEGVIVDTTNPEKLYYNESNLIPVLVKAIQELSAEVERLKAER